MIQLEKTGNGCWDIVQHASIGQLERERLIGSVIYRAGEETFVATLPWVNRDVITVAPSLPAAIHALIELHQLTDYQYAPWPTMEEDEE